jgi:hypothetical protein
MSTRCEQSMGTRIHQVHNDPMRSIAHKYTNYEKWMTATEVCVCVYVYVYVNVYVYAYVYADVYVHVYVYVYVYAYVYTYVYIYEYVHVHVYLYLYVYLYAYVYVSPKFIHTCFSWQACKHICMLHRRYTHTHTYTQRTWICTTSFQFVRIYLHNSMRWCVWARGPNGSAVCTFGLTRAFAALQSRVQVSVRTVFASSERRAQV